MLKKPLLQKLPLTFGSSFLIDRFESPYFDTPWHYHEEIEIVLCDGGFGKKFVGNHVSDYAEGDLAILGSNLPHWYRADDACYQHQKPASIVIHFLNDCFGKDFFEAEEMTEIKLDDIKVDEPSVVEEIPLESIAAPDPTPAPAPLDASVAPPLEESKVIIKVDDAPVFNPSMGDLTNTESLQTSESPTIKRVIFTPNAQKKN